MYFYIILLYFTEKHKYIKYTSYLSLYITLSVADLLLFKYAVLGNPYKYVLHYLRKLIFPNLSLFPKIKYINMYICF